MTSIGYGYCPRCGWVIVARERRLNGNDTCGKGCVFPSIDAQPTPRLCKCGHPPMIHGYGRTCGDGCQCLMTPDEVVTLLRSEHDRAVDRAHNITQGRAGLHALLYPALRDRARELGYALALHGSLVRDLDLVAVPWVENAAPAQVLAEALQAVIGKFFFLPKGSAAGWEVKSSPKPHGRVAYLLRAGAMHGKDAHELLQVDLSVTPRFSQA